jgi:CxxC motif-containing protein (DUF1111 family)
VIGRWVRGVLLTLLPVAAAAALWFVVGGRDDPRELPPPLRPRLGGLTTTFTDDRTAFGKVARGLVADELIRFSDGRVVFDRFYRPETGLDEGAIAANCAHCHPAHGRSLDPLGRVAPQLIGLGLLEAVPQAALVASADPGDADGDGISGRLGPGRFGWTASQPDVGSQVVHALAADFGVTQEEIGAEDVASLTLYTELLAVPARRGGETDAVRRGSFWFDEIGCAACHTPSHRTGESAVAALRRQEIWPYTDLLLHDLGDGEYRTPPLWGVGLLEVVHGEVVLMHDGRARSIEAAIEAHGGEAASAREAFADLDGTAKAELLAFLGSL